jgi:hypothetical protein
MAQRQFGKFNGREPGYDWETVILARPLWFRNENTWQREKLPIPKHPSASAQCINFGCSRLKEPNTASGMYRPTPATTPGEYRRIASSQSRRTQE